MFLGHKTVFGEKPCLCMRPSTEPAPGMFQCSLSPGSRSFFLIFGQYWPLGVRHCATDFLENASCLAVSTTPMGVIGTWYFSSLIHVWRKHTSLPAGLKSRLCNWTTSHSLLVSFHQDWGMRKPSWTQLYSGYQGASVAFGSRARGD